MPWISNADRVERLALAVTPQYAVCVTCGELKPECCGSSRPVGTYSRNSTCTECCVALGAHGVLEVCVVCEDEWTDRLVTGAPVCTKCSPKIDRFIAAKAKEESK